MTTQAIKAAAVAIGVCSMIGQMKRGKVDPKTKEIISFLDLPDRIKDFHVVGSRKDLTLAIENDAAKTGADSYVYFYDLMGFWLVWRFKSKVLRLNLKGCYFDAIASGEKTHEYRLASKWRQRLAGREFSEVHICRGYPKAGDDARVLRRKWKGYREEVITHDHFGAAPVKVLAIDVSEAA